MTQITGRLFIALGGLRIRTKAGASLETGGVERTPAESDAGVDGYTEKVVAPKLTCKIHHTKETKLSDLHGFTGAIAVETDTGRVYTLVDAFSMKPPTLEGGEVSLEFGARECQED